MELLNTVSLNGEVLNQKYYTLKNGSTIISLNHEYLNTLKNGNYILTLTYQNGVEITTTFEIQKQIVNPQTFDPLPFHITILLVGLIGFLSSLMHFKKINLIKKISSKI